MTEDLGNLWPCLAHDGVGDLFFDARPIFVASADGRRVLFANAAGRRHLRLAPDAGPSEAHLDDRLADRLARFATRDAGPSETRELLRTLDGLKAGLVSLVFRRLAAAGPIVVTVETTRVDERDARPDANLASLVCDGGLAALFAADGDVVAARGDHGAVDGLEEAVDALLDEGEDVAVVARSLAAPGGTRPVALVTLGTAPDAHRLLWVGPLVATETMPAAAPMPTSETMAEASAPSSIETSPDASGVEIDASASGVEVEKSDSAVEIEETAPVVETATAAAATEALDPGPAADVFAPATTVAAPLDRFDDAPFVAALPLAVDAFDEDAADAAWAAHAVPVVPTPRPVVPTGPAAATPTEGLEDLDGVALLALSPTATPSDLSSFVVDRPEGPTLPAPGSVTTAEDTAEIALAATGLVVPPAPFADAATPSEAPAPTMPPVTPPAATDAGPATPSPVETASGAFRFVPPGHAVKFVWQMDAERRFTLLSPELAAAIGGAVTDLVGRSWSEVAAELGFDGDGRIAEALARRDTWSGRTVLWPVEGEALRVPVDLAALPAFDRGRAFSGFRGFGTARADEPVPDPTGVGLRLRGAVAPVAKPATIDAAAPIAASAATPTEPAAALAASIEAPTAMPAPLVDEPELPPVVAPVVTEPFVTPDLAAPAAIADAAPSPTTTVAPEGVAAEAPSAEVAVIDAPEAAVVDGAEAASAWPDDAEIVHHETAPDAHGESVGDDAFAGEVETAITPTDTQDSAEEAEAQDPIASSEAAPTASPAPLVPEAPASKPRSTPETAAIAAAVAAYTAAGLPKSGPASVGAPKADLPRAADHLPRIVADAEGAASRLAETAEDRRNLSPPERNAFRQIAEALGSRAEAKPAAEGATPAIETIATAPADAAKIDAPTVPPVEPAAPVDVTPHASTSESVVAATTPIEPPIETAVVQPIAAAEVAPAPAAAAATTTAETEDAPTPSETDLGAAVAASDAAGPRPARISPRAALRAGDVGLLDRLPLAVAVVRDDALVYANERFLTLLRHPDLASLTRAGGLDALFAGEHVARRWQAGEGGRPMPVIAADGTVIPAEINLSTVPWGDASALLMSLVEVAPLPATPAPATEDEPSLEEEATTQTAPASPEATKPAALATVPTAPASNVVALPGVDLSTPRASEAVDLSTPRTPETTAPTQPARPLDLVRTADAERVAELEAIVDTATDGVLMLDADGLVLSANAGAEALFGCERRDMIGRPLADRLAPESRRSAADYLDGLARNGVASVLNDGREVIGAVKPEGLIPLFMTIGAISSGPVKKYCAVLRDITQWKKAEEDLTTARRRAEEASVHKSDFLAKISHEIRTPLNAIIGFSELMLDERFGPVGNERYKDYLRDIHVSGSHIMSLVNDLLDLSKVEAGKMDLRFEAVGLADLVTECVAMMQPQANRERIIIRSSLPTGVPPVVADPRSVRQVILNLLSNAIKFTPAGGQVIVSTTMEDNGEVVLRVRDTGYGMTDKEMQTAMEPFRQLHTTRSRSGGTGLGLPLTKALAEANRAVFRIDSTVGHGTLVSITFPVTRVLAS